MRLYYYATEAALAALWEEKIKITAPCDFNDPFEFLPSTANPTQDSRAWTIAFRDTSRNNFYVLSMSERKNNVRMWAQYGANHTGLMFEFDFDVGPFNELKSMGAVHQVKYHEPKRVLVDPAHYNDKDTIAILSRKGEDWAQEAEWRLIIPDSLLEKIGGSYGLLNGHVSAFIPMPYESLISVTLGHRSSSMLADSVDKVRENRSATWTIHKAKLSDDEFLLVDEKIS
jgi:hypothetical protein